MSRFSTTARAAVVAAFTAGALFGIAGTASATPNTEPPVSGDDRATAHEGNVVGKHCPDLFPGSQVIAKGDLTFETDGSNTYLDITAVADGVEVVGVIVKGGPAYNVYEPADLGELPWLDLHSPLVPSGKPAQISHWFACGVKDTTTTTTNPTSSASETETSPTSTPGGEEPSSSTAATDTTPDTTTSEDVAPAAQESELADTGVDAGWLVALGAALLLGGGALLFLMRTRGARR